MQSLTLCERSTWALKAQGVLPPPVRRRGLPNDLNRQAVVSDRRQLTLILIDAEWLSLRGLSRTALTMVPTLWFDVKISFLKNTYENASW